MRLAIIGSDRSRPHRQSSDQTPFQTNMKNKLIDRTWLSPFTSVAFGVIGVTGLLLFFHVKNGPIMALHEWFGWTFVVAGALHLLLNWRPLLSYLRRWSAVAALAGGLALVVGLAVGGASGQPRSGGGRPMTPVVAALDTNGNGSLEVGEIADAGAALQKLDKNGDGIIGADELQARPEH